jgi:copper chaperone NosL
MKSGRWQVASGKFASGRRQVADGWILLTVYCLLLTFLAACGSAGAMDEPPEIRYGQDVCDQCGMIISEARFAASYVTTQGDVRRFESISDMLVYHQQQQEEVHIFWVHDYETEEWLRADEAFFVLSEEIITPMGPGMLATAAEATADTLATQKHGTVLSFDALMAMARTGELEVHGHH